MLIIKGICLLLSHPPTSHTTVRAVRHTAVPILDSIRDMNPLDTYNLVSVAYHLILQ